MIRKVLKLVLKVAPIVLIVGVGVYVAGCVRFSNGTWMVKEAPLPEGWPEMTPIGEVEVKQYPVYRAAVVDESRVDPTMQGMFTSLFDHIKRNDIAMTTPVEMEYARGEEPQMTSMAFIYRKPTWGEAGEDGEVVVRDIDSQLMASLGVRGNYTDERFKTNLVILDQWLSENAERYQPIGSPRYLGYNGPFTLPFMRYGEVQVRVQAMDTSSP